ncbi:hypothetical protein [Streptomyces sp. NPDC088400]|uniref:hypothetical protein n=1 Tax=Streptomyces sp. NPDC088400 TaxID=3365861 RepID=UPI003810E8C5
MLARLSVVPSSLSSWRGCVGGGRADTEHHDGGSGDGAGPAVTGNETVLAAHIEYGFDLAGRAAPRPGRWARLTIM